MRRIQTFPTVVYGEPAPTAGNCVSIKSLCVYNRPAALHLDKHSVGQKQVFLICIKEIMSDAHTEHTSFIRTPKQLIIAVAGFFLVIVIGIILLVIFATNKPLGGAGSESQSAQAIAARVRPVAEEGFAFKDANAPKILQSGQAVYNAVCIACHGTGAAGAPKAGDAGAWSARIAQGYDTLVQHAVQGIRAMPAKGGNPDLDNIEVARAVAFMANQAGAKFKEPEAPAVSAAPAQANAAAPAANAAPATPAATPGTPPTAGALATPAVAGNNEAGKALFNATCTACHGAGIAGAPKFGDKAAWAPRIAQGTSMLYQHAIKGFQGEAGMMPPRGGSTAPDADVKAAVDYMVAAAK
jgi:cytochrome c5